ncbi:DUF3885 domain-containing protein [Alkalihalophilus marmarensis]|uniref:DUF3885 domain-containing protein n=1 Tax=Alkalihalophilus marmarensis TaxID=521377 RepID=UPI00203A9E1F|nr:DUF3885 domain-containing protein [Alkalihalophilus marmarensis]MCM3489407.1 DUF3885 domain-containing protein [Alkalihalophilus marmarensis]
MVLDEYMQENFPALTLKPPLFYDWNIGIRFKLGVDYDSESVYENCPYLKGVNNRAVTLFESLHKPDDEILLVIDVNDFADGESFKRKLNIFSKYVKQKSVLYKLQQRSIPFVFPEDDDEGIYRTHRFTLKCTTADIRYSPMIKAICNHDMGLKPAISHDVYFINLEKETIFHIYDDRGCDLIATSIDRIRAIYDKYNDWILDYDRNQIEKVFQNSSIIDR